MIKCIFIISSLMLAQVNAASKYYDGENRPYEFGFKIEGNQHRHEKKDENGIIMGEFGFITADNVYHVTVYATDADGHFKILSMKNIRLMSEPMAKNVAAAIDTMRSNFESSSPQPAPMDTTTTPQPFVIHSTATPLKELEVMTVEPTTPKASNIQSCSNCKIPEPPRPASFGRSSLPPEMQSIMERFQPQGAPNPPNPSNPSNLNLMDENSFDGGQEQDLSPGYMGNQVPEGASAGLENPPTPPSTSLSPPLSTPSSAKEDYSADFNSMPEGGPEGRSLGNDDVPMALTPESNGESSPPEDMPIESVMARFKGVEMARQQQPEDQQYYSPQQRSQSPASEDAAQVDMEQMLQGLLYLFNYTAGYHGHNEQGDREGNKEGGYYVVGRDGFRRSTEYRANQFGYQPKFTLERVSEEETPREETEKEAGLKGNEFKWFYL